MSEQSTLRNLVGGMAVRVFDPTTAFVMLAASDLCKNMLPTTGKTIRHQESALAQAHEPNQLLGSRAADTDR